MSMLMMLCKMEIRWRTRGLLNLMDTLLFVALTAPNLSAIMAQQQYNNSLGYVCNGRDQTCSTYGLYRTYQGQETLQKVAGYFNVTTTAIANASGLMKVETNAPLPKGQALYVPLNCSCGPNGTYEMLVPHTVNSGDTYALLAITIYGGLTRWEAIIVANPTTNYLNLGIGDTIVAPIFCACPTLKQIANGTKFLVTFGIVRADGPNDTLNVISSYFGVTTAQLSAANKLAVNATLGKRTQLLVPLASLPPIASMNFPHVAIPIGDSSHRRKVVGLVAGLSCGGAFLCVLLVALFMARRRANNVTEHDEFHLVDENLVLRMFTYKELSKATNNFSRSQLLGSGGFGAVYKGTLTSGAAVAVKRLMHESKSGKSSFQAEAASLSQIRHRNLVQLRGWCHQEGQLLLVYDYMCNGSLNDWLFHFERSCEKAGIKNDNNNHGDRPCVKNTSHDHLKEAEALTLTLRHSVLSGVAAALSYLHEECAKCVLHRDIKSSNVLLDADLNAYLGDFGLARLIDHGKMEKTTMMAGTLGYMAPEMPHTGTATKETDVYSFGILMLEVMCGKRPLDVTAIERGHSILVDRVWQAHEAGDLLQVADSRLLPISHPARITVAGTADAAGSCSGFESSEGYSAENSFITDQNSMHDVDIVDGNTMEADDRKKMIRNLLHLALLCCNPNPEDRPSMRFVCQLLQSSEYMEMSMPPLPACKPISLYLKPGYSQSIIRRHAAAAGSPDSSSVLLQDAPQGSEPATFDSCTLSGR